MRHTRPSEHPSSTSQAARAGVGELRVLSVACIIVAGLVITLAPPPIVELVSAQTGTCGDPEDPCSGTCCSDGMGGQICCASGGSCCNDGCCADECIDDGSGGEICCPDGQVACNGSCCEGSCLDDGQGGKICCEEGQIVCGGVCCAPAECCDTDDDGEGDSCGYLCDSDDDGLDDACNLCDTNGNGNNDACYICDHAAEADVNDDCYRCDLKKADGTPGTDGIDDSCFKCDNDGDGFNDDCCGKSTTGTKTKTYSRGNDDVTENIYETANHTVTAKVVSGGPCTTRHATITITYATNLTGNPADPQPPIIAPQFTVIEDGNNANHNGSGLGGTLTITKNNVWGGAVSGQANIAFWPNRPAGMPSTVQQELNWSADIDDCGKVSNVTVTLKQNVIRAPTPLKDTTGGAAGYPAFPGIPRP